MSPSQTIVLTTPLFAVLIAIEYAVARARGRSAYRLNDAIGSISLGVLSQTSAVFTRLLRIGIYTALFDHVALWRNDAFWTSAGGWLLALLFYDFCYYWLHRMGHEVGVLWANAQVYAALAHDSWQARRWSDKLRVWLKPPGWRPADVAARFPKPAFDMAQLPLFNPAMRPALRGFAAVQMVLLLAGVSVFLWQADAAPLADNAVWFAALLAAQWALGAAVQGRIGMLQALMIEAGALATATSALGLVHWHWLFKPMVLLFAIALIATSACQISARGIFHHKSWRLLLAALTLSLAGDVLLMLHGLFIPGLVAFLLAHLAYLGLLRQDAPWFAQRSALLATLAVGMVVYAFL